jgi:SAM-dependent methyltransferase
VLERRTRYADVWLAPRLPQNACVLKGTRVHPRIDRSPGRRDCHWAGSPLWCRAMAAPSSSSGRFEPAVEAWLSGLGLVRDAVRQELVRRQLAVYLSDLGSIEVLDAGCGQGTQAIALARLGHNVVGLDLSATLLDTALEAAAAEPNEVQERMSFVIGDLLALEEQHARRYDIACCHGVAMYLPSLTDCVNALAGAVRPGGFISLLTRNRASIAMRAGMRGRWAEALDGFDARTYKNRVGIEAVRADDPREVQDALQAAGADIVAWFGVRLFTDHWERERPGDDFSELLAAEEEAGRRDPYRSLAALTHTIARLR